MVEGWQSSTAVWPAAPGTYNPPPQLQAPPVYKQPPSKKKPLAKKMTSSIDKQRVVYRWGVTPLGRRCGVGVRVGV